jgi:CRP-like cAMP-binding protein
MNAAGQLSRHPVTQGFSAPQLEALASCARMAVAPAGTVVFKEGGVADSVYLVLDGRISLEQHVPGRGTTQLESLGAGDLLGFSWIMPDRRWLLHARAAETTQLIVLDGACVRALMAADCDLALRLSQQVILHLYQRLERVRLQRLDVYGQDR